MDPLTLISTIKSEPNSTKLCTLKSILDLVQDLKWSDVSGILDFFPRSARKIEALKIIVSANKITTSVSDSLLEIIQSINSDADKVLAISILRSNIFSISGSQVASILQNITYNSFKVRALKILIPYISDDISENIYVNEKSGLISCQNALLIIENINSTVNKIHFLKLLILNSKLKITSENIEPILENTFIGKEKMNALRTALNINLQIADEKNISKIIGILLTIRPMKIILNQITSLFDFIIVKSNLSWDSYFLDKYKLLIEAVSNVDYVINRYFRIHNNSYYVEEVQFYNDGRVLQTHKYLDQYCM